MKRLSQLLHHVRSRSIAFHIYFKRKKYAPCTDIRCLARRNDIFIFSVKNPIAQNSFHYYHNLRNAVKLTLPCFVGFSKFSAIFSIRTVSGRLFLSSSFLFSTYVLMIKLPCCLETSVQSVSHSTLLISPKCCKKFGKTQQIKKFEIVVNTKTLSALMPPKTPAAVF